MRIELLLCLFFTFDGEGDNLISDTISAGYGLQEHKVITMDGYILTMHRIPYSKPEAMSEVTLKPPILVMHGMMGTSASFINQGSKSKLAYALSDAGFDVWLGNARGNPFSRAHETLNPDQDWDKFDFFNFSWEEIAIFDIPAMVDYVIGVTREERIRFIGDTHGGTAFLILNSLKPEYNKKFIMAQLLDPVGYTKYFPSVELKAAALMIDHLYALGQASGIVEISTLDLQTNLTGGVTPHIALQILVSYMAALGRYTTMGTSLKQLTHYAQNIRDSSFRRWDYGQNTNHKIYGTDSPPPYKLSSTTVYTILYYRKNNVFLDERDVKDMASDMPKAKAVGINETEFSYSDLVEITRTSEV